MRPRIDRELREVQLPTVRVTRSRAAKIRPFMDAGRWTQFVNDVIDALDVEGAQLQDRDIVELENELRVLQATLAAKKAAAATAARLRAELLDPAERTFRDWVRARKAHRGALGGQWSSWILARPEYKKLGRKRCLEILAQEGVAAR